MSKKELFEAFCKLHPSYKNRVVCYKKFGSRVLIIYINPAENAESKNIQSLAFLYYSDDNWQLGTKLWRRKPASGKPTHEGSMDNENQNNTTR